ncbi:MAG TPA: RNA polymerase sigma factor [Polyangiaceae bacterium]|nr:RNA polymerase sigma factor [Polyangiaceae bacterium]
MKSSRTRLRLIQGSSNDGLGEQEDLIERGPDSEAAAIRELGDDSLVTLGAQGDTRAAEMLYRRHASFAFNLAVRIAGSSHDVEDIVHDAFLRAFDSLPTLRNPKAFKSWLGSIVVHAVRSRLRRSRLLRVLGIGTRGEAIDIDCIASEEASPRTRAELAQIYALLQTLAPDDRIAWTLRFVEGHDLKAAADLCDCSLATIKRRIRRAQSYIETHFVAAGEQQTTSERQPRKKKERAS